MLINYILFPFNSSLYSFCNSFILDRSLFFSVEAELNTSHLNFSAEILVPNGFS